MKGAQVGDWICPMRHITMPAEQAEQARNDERVCHECGLPLWPITAIDTDGYEYLGWPDQHKERSPAQ